MATNNPRDPNGPDDDKDKKNPELPDWLRTDDWLQITPPPPSKIIPGHPAAQPPAGGPTLPGEDQATDMIELEEDDNVYNVEVPPSTMLFSDPDDSVNLTDDLPIVGPMSGKLKSGTSSIKLRSTKAKPATDPDMLPPDATPPVGSGQPASDDEIDLGAMPTAENPRTAGPATSGVLRPASPATDITPIGAAASEDALGQPLDPTGPASGWLSSATKLPTTPAPTPPPVKQSNVPSVANVSGTWADLDVPAASKMLPTTPLSPTNLTSPPEDTSDSWHPSSGNVGLPSLANIDLPPQAIEEGSDIFSRATRPGAAAGATAYEPPKIAKPAAPTPPPEKAKTEPTPTPPSLKLPSQPDLPAEVQPGSWHPSSENLNLPSMGNIDLPPAEGSSADVFSAATRPGRPAEPRAAKPPAPMPAGLEATVIGGMAPIAKPTPKPVAPDPNWLEATNLSVVPTAEKPTDPASGWLAGASTVGQAAPPAEVDLEPTTDFGQGSNADIDLPPPRTDEASDIFTTARESVEKSALPRPSTDSELYSGAMPFDPRELKSLTGSAGDSNLFADPPEKPKADDVGRVELAPPKPKFEGTVDLRLSQILPGSKSDAVNFAMPPGSADDSAASGGIEVVDTSGTLDDEPPAKPYENPLAGDVVPEPKFGSLGDDLGDDLEAELLRDEGKPDFNLFPAGQPSDSNLLGDRTFVDEQLNPPHSSSVNLTDPNAYYSNDPADSGQPSSIFNKLDKSGQASGGNIDLDSIPLMGSADEATNRMETSGSAVLGGRLDEPGDLEESVFDVKMPKPEGADSGMIDWSTDARVTDRLGQASLDQTQRSDYAEQEPAAAVPMTPRPRGSDATRPRSRPELTPEELEDLEPKAKRSPWLFAALGLLAGAGIGGVTMYNAGGSGTGTGGGDPTGKVAALEKRAADVSRTADELDANYKKLLADSEGLKKKAADGDKAEAALKQAEDDKQRLAIEVGAAKDKLNTEIAVAKKLGEDAAAKKFETEKAKLTADAKKAADEKTKLLADVKTAADENAALAKMVEAATKDVTAKGMELDKAKAAAEAVTAKLKAADATLDPVIDKLKAAKLIDDKADREKAIAALPEALKKANLITGEGEAAKLAKELTEARDTFKKQKDDADKAIKEAADKLAVAKTAADKQLADAKTAAEKSMADLQAKADAADKRIVDEVKKAVADATKDAEAKVLKSQETIAAQKQAAEAEVQKERTARAADQKQFEARLSTMQEQFARDVESARRGFTPTNNDVLIAKAEQAVTSYDAGTAAYFAGRYADAEKLFAAAAKADLADARYWYFLGLSKYAQGKAKEAEADFKTGAEWEGRAKPGRRTVASALERVQGPARLALEAARP